MSDLTEYLASERIDLDSQLDAREGILAHLAHLLGGADEAAREAVHDDLLAREQMATTGIGSGVAFPHARVDFLPGIRLAFVRTRKPVDFRALDGRGVDLFVAVAGPKQERREYLSVLAKLAYLFGSPATRRAFRSGENARKIRDLFHEADAPS